LTYTDDLAIEDSKQSDVNKSDVSDAEADNQIESLADLGISMEDLNLQPEPATHCHKQALAQLYGLKLGLAHQRKSKIQQSASERTEPPLPPPRTRLHARSMIVSEFEEKISHDREAAEKKMTDKERLADVSEQIADLQQLDATLLHSGEQEQDRLKIDRKERAANPRHVVDIDAESILIVRLLEEEEKRLLNLQARARDAAAQVVRVEQAQHEEKEEERRAKLRDSEETRSAASTVARKRKESGEKEWLAAREKRELEKEGEEREKQRKIRALVAQKAARLRAAAKDDALQNIAIYCNTQQHTDKDYTTPHTHTHVVSAAATRGGIGNVGGIVGVAGDGTVTNGGQGRLELETPLFNTLQQTATHCSTLRLETSTEASCASSNYSRASTSSRSASKSDKGPVSPSPA